MTSSAAGFDKIKNGVVKACVSEQYRIPAAPKRMAPAFWEAPDTFAACFSEIAHNLAPTPAQMFVTLRELKT
jgi:hypothetical protein